MGNQSSSCKNLDADPDNNITLSHESPYIPARLPLSKSHLLSLAWAQNWDAVWRRCQTHPREAFEVNGSHRTALHLAMFAFDSVPTSVIVALLGANKYAVFCRDSIGWTPLHYACQFGSNQDVLAVIMCCIVNVMNSASEGMTREFLRGSHAEWGRWRDIDSPLFLACARKSTDFRTINVLLHYARRYPEQLGTWMAPVTGGERWDDFEDEESGSNGASNDCIRPRKVDSGPGGNSGADPFLALARGGAKKECENSPVTPLEVLWSQICPRRRRSSILSIADDDDSSSSEDESDDDESTKSGAPPASPLDKVTLILLSSTPRRHRQCFGDGTPRKEDEEADDDDDDDDDPSLETPHSIFERVPDEYKLQMLHHMCALQVPMPDLVNYGIQSYADQISAPDSMGGNLPLHHAVLSFRVDATDGTPHSGTNQEKRRGIVETLVQVYPKAACVPNRRGMFPINLATRVGLPWTMGLETLVDAAPQTLYARDPATHLYPFMQASVCGGALRGDCLDTIYRLVRRCPDLVTGGPVSKIFKGCRNP